MYTNFFKRKNCSSLILPSFLASRHTRLLFLLHSCAKKDDTVIMSESLIAKISLPVIYVLYFLHPISFLIASCPLGGILSITFVNNYKVDCQMLCSLKTLKDFSLSK